MSDPISREDAHPAVMAQLTQVIDLNDHNKHETALRKLISTAVSAALRALPPAQEAAPPHPDDASIDRFAAALKEKMRYAREVKGRGGWDTETCSAQHLSDLLRGHLNKANGEALGGDPVDVGNFCMMLFNRGDRVQPVVQEHTTPAPRADRGAGVLA